MAARRILVITHGRHLRKECENFRDMARAQNVEIDVEFLDVLNDHEIPEALREAGPADALRIEPSLSSLILPDCSVVPLNVSLVQAADLFLWREERWQPELLLGQALHDAIVAKAKTLDLTQSAFVTGQGAELRIVAGVCLGLGFKKVRLIGEDEEDLREQAERLKRTYVAAEIQGTVAHELTLQTVGASLLINGIDLADKPEVSIDLSYFNFMKRDGLVVDLKSVDKESAMLAEASRAELRTLPAMEVSSFVDLLLVRKLGLENQIRPSVQ